MTTIYLMHENECLIGAFSTGEIALACMFNTFAGYTLDSWDRDSVSWLFWWMDNDTGDIRKITIERMEVDDPYIINPYEDEPTTPQGELRLD